MKITELRLSFIQIECLAHPLRSVPPPTIPFSFLLSGPMFQKQFAQVLNSGGSCMPPWQNGYGKLFWQYYIGRRQTTKDLWRALVPLQYDSKATLSTASFTGAARPRTYLYPWGIGTVVDIGVNDSLDLEAAVTLAISIRRSSTLQVHLHGNSSTLGLTALINLVSDTVRSLVYGAGMPKGQTSDLFSIVTFADGEGVDPAEEIKQDSDIHRALEAVTGWSPLWKQLNLNPLANATIPITQSPAGHILYGGRRGRAVWFPGNFRSVAAYGRTLSCYHQNLTMATLQTESLCQITKDTAVLLANAQPLANFSFAYRNCAQLAAGLLGRLYGGMFDTYRSRSVAEQIRQLYKNPVSLVRTHFNMPPLNP